LRAGWPGEREPDAERHQHRGDDQVDDARAGQQFDPDDRSGDDTGHGSGDEHQGQAPAFAGGRHVVARKIGYRWHHPPRLTAERDMFAITGLPPLLARAPAAPGSMYADLRTSNPRHPSRRRLGFSHCRSADSELRQ
jgi:hypothetical protein